MSPQPLYLLLSGPQPGTSSNQPRFTAWLRLGISKPRASNSHLRSPYSSGRVALGKTQVGADLSLHHLGNRKACTPSGQYRPHWSTMTLPLHKLILHGGWRLVVNGHSQSLQLTGWDKSLPLTCQQQSCLSNKRRVYSAHRKGTPLIPSLVDRGGCSTGHYRIPTTLGPITKTGSHSS